MPLQAYLATEPETEDDIIDQNLDTDDLAGENSDTDEGVNNTTVDGYVDEPGEWDSGSSDGGIFTSVNQNSDMQRTPGSSLARS